MKFYSLKVGYNHGFMRQLCVTTSGRWQPGVPLMMFTAYIDESDTHGPTPDITLSAMLSTVGRWERCDRAYARLRKRLGFEIFHATDFKSSTGEFEDWPLPKCVELLEGFGLLGFDHLTECYTVHCRYEDYEKHFLQKKPLKMHRVSQYGICFMGALDHMLSEIDRRGSQHQLSIVVEDGHKNASDTARLFKEYKDQLGRTGNSSLLSHALASKKDAPLLQLADVSAHGHTIERRRVKRGMAIPFEDRPTEQIAPNLPGWTIVEITSGYFDLMIEQYNAGRAELHEKYLKRRQAWIDAKLASDGQSS